jgi:hypothetical protein
MSLTTFTDGTDAVASEVNNNFKAGAIKSVYTGTGFNATLTSTTSNTATASYEIPAITAANLGSADYLIIDMTVTTVSGGYYNSGTIDEWYPSIKVEVKETGGAYGAVLAETAVSRIDAITSEFAFRYNDLKTIRITHTLTAGQKANGAQVKITGKATVDNASGDSRTTSITNVNTVVRCAA